MPSDPVKRRLQAALWVCVRYGLVLPILLVAAYSLAVPLVNDKPGTPVLVCLLAVMVSAWAGGFGPGILATALILLLTLSPDFDLGRQLRFGVFALTGVFISALVESLHRARKRARLEAATLGAVLGASEDHIYILDRKVRYLKVSEGGARVLGKRPDEMIGKTWQDLALPREVMEEFEVHARQALETEAPVRGESLPEGADGPSTFEYIMTPVSAGSSHVDTLIVISRDISDRKRAEFALRQADQRKDEFLAMLAHELRNPLAAIANAVEADRRELGERPGGWGREIIDRQVKHLGRLIDDLLDVSRITRGKVELRRESVAIGALMKSAAEAVRPLVERRSHFLDVQLPSGPLWVEGDPVRLEQILGNLLTNAAKYSDPGGRITVSTAQAEGSVMIRVKDSGIGIAPDQLPRMFELFAQGDRSLARSEGGLGIGLTLARSLATLHGGTLSATSEGSGQGSEFTLRLPLASPPAGVVSRPQTEPPSVERTARILVVDDNVETARGMSRLLRLLGHDVRTANGGLRAIAEAVIFRPQIVLLDIGLPGMDGYEVARRLRESAELSGKTLIIAISGYGRAEDQRLSLEAGFDHHLVKPVDFQVLNDLIILGANPPLVDQASGKA